MRNTGKAKAIRDWFEQKFIQWRSRQPSRKATLNQFAAEIGINRDVLNTYMLRGSAPEGDNLMRVGLALGWAIYDLVGEPRPDPLLIYVVTNWGCLTDDDRNAIARLLDVDPSSEIRSPDKIDCTVEQPRLN